MKKMVLLVCCCWLLMPFVTKAEDQLPGLKIGSEAPDFTLVNVDGEKLSLSAFRGKKIMLNFWATWCAPCKQEMTDFQAFYHKNADPGIEIIAVNIDPKSNVANYIQRLGIQFPVVLDDDDRVNEMYQVLVIPTTYFIDEKGVIRDKYYSAMPLPLIEKKLREF